MRWKKSRAVAASSLVVAIACGGKEAGPGETCGAFFDELAAMFAQCGAPQRLDPATRGAFVDYCNALATAPGVGDVAGQYAACAKNLDPNICGGPQCSLRGTLSPNTACTDDAQCASGFCVPTGQAAASSEQTCGTCGAVAEQGESCNGTTPCDVFAGLYCGVSGTCQSLVAQGGSCSNNEACRAELFCDAATKTCAPLPTKGQPCTTACMAAYACLSGVCADRVAASGACPTGNECQLDLFCDPQSHVCVSGGAAGEACSTTSFVQCAFGLRCISGACVAAKLEGAPCAPGNLECATDLVCAGGTCKPPDFTLCK